jgi:[ribosomal protein S5]-alanine N-acetyltransferase
MNYAGAREVAATTLNIPHPYEPGMAEQWISNHAEQLESDQTVNYAIVLLSENHAIGGIGLHAIALDHQRAEMGYCIGVPWWGQGYCTEAAHAILAYGFETIGLNRIEALHFASNTASGRVMQKIGMRHEGHLRQHVVKWGQPFDDEIYGILKEDYLAAKA